MYSKYERNGKNKWKSTKVCFSSVVSGGREILPQIIFIFPEYQRLYAGIKGENVLQFVYVLNSLQCGSICKRRMSQGSEKLQLARVVRNAY